jgi:hypothetical protein
MAETAPPKKKTKNPWDRQDGEPVTSWERFVLYRDMRQRSLARLSRVLGFKTYRSMETLSAKYGWVERCAAWDIELNRRLLDLQVTDIHKMKQRHINMGIGMQTAVLKELKAWVHRIEEADRKAVKNGKSCHKPILKIGELVRLADSGINIERLSRGESTDLHGVRDETKHDLSRLSKADLKNLKALKEKTGA